MGKSFKKLVLLGGILVLTLLSSCGKAENFTVSEKYWSELVYEKNSESSLLTHAKRDAFYFLKFAEEELIEIHSYEILSGEESTVSLNVDKDDTVVAFAVNNKGEYWLCKYLENEDTYSVEIDRYDAKGELLDTIVLSDLQLSEFVSRLFFDDEDNLNVITNFGLLQYSNSGKFIARKNAKADTYYSELSNNQYLTLYSGNISLVSGDKSETILSLFEHGILQQDVREFHTFGKDGIYLITIKTTDVGNKLYVYTFVPNKDTEDDSKKKITIATYGGMETSVERMILEYNTVNSEYVVEVIDYCHNDEVSLDDALIKLGADIVSGKGPDIIDDGMFDMNALEKQGYLEDLFPYFESDNSVDLSLYMESIIDTYVENDHLYRIPTSFRVATCYGNAQVIGDKNVLNLNELYQIMEENPQIHTVFGAGKEITLRYLFQYNQDLFMDWEQTVCSFDSDEFKKLLTFVKNRDDYEKSEGDAWEAVQNQTQLLCREFSHGNLFFQYGKSVIEDMVVIGFPSSSLSRTVAAPEGLTFSMTVNSDNKAGVWDFLKFALSKEQQDKQLEANESLYGWSYPVMKSSFYQYMENISTPEYETNEDGSVSEKKITTYNGIPIYAMTQKGKEEFIQDIESLSYNVFLDNELYNIIYEEASYYFEGQKSVDEVADIIQNRVSIYINS